MRQRNAVLVLAAAASAAAALVWVSLDPPVPIAADGAEQHRPDAVATPVVGATARTTPAAGLTISGFVTVRGRPVADRTVTLSGTSAGNKVGDRTRTDPNGRYEFAVDPGTYTVVAEWVGKSWGAGPSEPRGSADVEVVDTSVKHHLWLPPGRIEVTVVDADSREPVAGAIVRRGGASGSAKYALSTDELGRAWILEALCRPIAIEVVAPRYRSTGFQTAWPTTAQPTVRLQFEVERAGTLAVTFVDAEGRRRSAPPHTSVVARPIDAALDEGVLRLDFVGKSPRAFEGLRPGRYEVAIADETHGDLDAPTVRFQPVEPGPPKIVEVRAGQREIVELELCRRARVKLEARRSRLRPAFNSTMVVTPLEGPYAERQVLPLAREVERPPPFGRFDGHLPPGEYAVEVRHEDGRTWRERVAVGTEPIDRDVEVPW